MYDDVAQELFGRRPGVPARIGRFVVLDRVDERGSPAVYEAFDPARRRRVIVELQARGRHRRRLGALAGLQHPNVVDLYEVGRFRGVDFVVTEHVGGMSLARRSGRGSGPRELSDGLLRHLTEAARGLAAAHAVGVEHGGFGPTEVQVGHDGHARVAGFGRAVTDPQDDQVAFSRAAVALLRGRAGSDVVLPVLRRGMKADPHARYPSMDALADALRLASERRPRFAAAIVLAGAGIGALVGWLLA